MKKAIKKIVLFEAGYINFSKINLNFVKIEEELYAAEATEEELQTFLRVNELKINKFGHLMTPSSPPTLDGRWGYVDSIAPIFLLNLPV